MSLKPLRKTKTPASKAANTRALGAIALCGIIMALVMAARQVSNPVEISAAPASLDMAPAAQTIELGAVPAMPALAPARTTATGTAKKTVVPKATGVRETSAQSAAAPKAQPATLAAAPAATPAAPPAAAPATIVAQHSADVITINGCLERDDTEFQLKNATGADLPKARSWKSGFVKKSSPTIDLVDANSLRLASHAGHRVSVSGVLKDREMQVRSIQRVAGECK